MVVILYGEVVVYGVVGYGFVDGGDVLEFELMCVEKFGEVGGEGGVVFVGIEFVKGLFDGFDVDDGIGEVGGVEELFVEIVFMNYDVVVV